MIIQQARLNELEEIMRMYNSCVSGMIKNNIDQWDETYPNSNVIYEDIKLGSYYICKIDDKIVGGINIDQLQDPTYLDINWKDNSDSFLVVHRLGVKIIGIMELENFSWNL